MSEIERKFFVFVGILEEGNSDAFYRHHYSYAISQLTFRVSNTCTSPFTINVTEEGPLRFTDKRHSLKRKENWRKFFLLGIQTGDKLAKPLFFVAYSWLCRHCRNLAEGGLVSCRDFILCSVATFWVMSLVGIYLGRASNIA